MSTRLPRQRSRRGAGILRLILFGLCAGLVASPLVGQSVRVRVVTTVLDGDPLDPADARSTFDPGESLSINVLLDTRDTAIWTGGAAVSFRFPAGVLEKRRRGEGEPPGSGWPLQPDGRLLIMSTEELPAGIQGELGNAFVVIGSSTENTDCPCDDDNGAGMEAVTHSLVVDMNRRKSLAPAQYVLFQTDWRVVDDVSVERFEVELANGPGGGLRGNAEPLMNLVSGSKRGEDYGVGSGLELTSAMVMLGGPRTSFVRGDVDADGMVSIADPIRILLFLFRGATLDCARAGDLDLSETLSITDAIRTLEFLFLGGIQPPPPFPTCGVAETPSLLECERGCAGAS